MENNNEYMEDSQGRMVPLSVIKPEDLLMDATVKTLVDKAKNLNGLVKSFKEESFSEIETFIEILAEKYNAKVGGKKGNAVLYTYDGKLKVQRSFNEYIVFGPELKIAQDLINECIETWSEGANDKLKTLVNDAFKRDKEGKVSTVKVLGLRRLKISDDKWQTAMQAITDSMRVSDTKSYVRFYERVGQTDEYKQISLDIASI